ncbi:MAG TPA: hypothetical protein VFT96_09760 [Gemmatimonadaceae bacterium]|nr:hypothetical protein [Gemmatimonadaceae bacterium]
MAFALITGCEATPIVVPDSQEPFVYLVLDPTARDRVVTNDRTQYAAVLTTRTPLQSPCRSVQRFDMHASGETMPFGWRIAGECFTGPTSILDQFTDSCCHLPEVAGTDSLGAVDLEYGETYLIEIETEGRVVRGRATLPADFQVVLVQRNGQRWLTWPRVVGAGGYQVRLSGGETRFLSDTMLLVAHSDGVAGFVSAFDDNLYRYVTDEELTSSGVEGAFGVFGAVTTRDFSF